jgi:hypothetical protein
VPELARPPDANPAKPRAWAAFSSKRLPASALEWTWLVTGVAAVAAVARQLLFGLAPLFARPARIGHHAWDTAAALRYMAVKAILRFHEFPSWNPYACGGHPAWGAPEGDPNVASPLLPAYLALPLARATHVEILVYSIAGGVGTWLLASRFTRSPALRALAVAVFAFDGRWAMQIAAGHLWHLGYALVPWALFFLDRALGAEPELGRPRGADVVAGAVCLALLVYGGDAYLFPQVALLLVAYVGWVALASRSARPLVAFAQTVAVAAGLAAPKLVPALAVAAHAHRAVTDAASVSPAALSIALLDATQTFRANVPGVSMDAWCEVGLYVGTAGVAWLLLGAVFAAGPREQALRAIAAVSLALGLGPFHGDAPWSLARSLPLLSSQEMPSRWLYLAVLALACVAAGASERLLSRAGRARPWLEALVAAAVIWTSVDIAVVARRALEEEITVVAEPTPEQTSPFVTEAQLPANLQSAAGGASPASLPAERANVGTIECDTFADLANAPGLAGRYALYDGRPTEIGARGRGDADYHGEAFLEEGRGTATITAWAPGRVDVAVDGAQPGDHLVLNQNDDPGWSVDGADSPTRSTTGRHAVTALLRAGTTTVRFRHHTRGAWLGVLLFVVTIALLVRVGRARRGVAAGVLSP